MKRLIEVTRETAAPYSIYLYYTRNLVAQTKTLDENGEVNVDLDESGEVVGIEILAPDDETIAVATRFALENGLSLAGVFDPRTLSV